MCSEFSCQAPAPTLLQYEKANLWERREKKEEKKKKRRELETKTTGAEETGGRGRAFPSNHKGL